MNLYLYFYFDELNMYGFQIIWSLSTQRKLRVGFINDNRESGDEGGEIEYKRLEVKVVQD